MLCPLLNVLMVQVMPLSALGFVGGDKVMLETKLEDGTWPRYRYIEEPNFRDFREGDRLDAMDYQGRWFRGQVTYILLYRVVQKFSLFSALM